MRKFTRACTCDHELGVCIPECAWSPYRCVAPKVANGPSNLRRPVDEGEHVRSILDEARVMEELAVGGVANKAVAFRRNATCYKLVLFGQRSVSLAASTSDTSCTRWQSYGSLVPLLWAGRQTWCNIHEAEAQS